LITGCFVCKLQLINRLHIFQSNSTGKSLIHMTVTNWQSNSTDKGLIHMFQSNSWGKCLIHIFPTNSTCKGLIHILLSKFTGYSYFFFQCATLSWQCPFVSYRALDVYNNWLTLVCTIGTNCVLEYNIITSTWQRSVYCGLQHCIFVCCQWNICINIESKSGRYSVVYSNLNTIRYCTFLYLHTESRFYIVKLGGRKTKSVGKKTTSWWKVSISNSEVLIFLNLCMLIKVCIF